MKQKGATREVISKIQRLRKRVGVNPQDHIVVAIDFAPESQTLAKAVEAQLKLVEQVVKKTVVLGRPEHLYAWGETAGVTEGESYVVSVCQPHVRLNEEKIKVGHSILTHHLTQPNLEQIWRQDPTSLEAGTLSEQPKDCRSRT